METYLMGLFKRKPYRDKDNRGKLLGFKMRGVTDMEKYRADTFYTKEPETLVWIDGFKQNSIFIDVGANIGVYSLYCAMTKPRVQVYAFEPSRANFVRLDDNISLNSAWNIAPFNMAMSRTQAIFPFYVPNTQIGASGGQVGRPIDEHGEKFEPECENQVFTISFDNFFELIPNKRPTYLKIDVDGREMDVIRGISRHAPALEGVLVEVNTDCVTLSDVTQKMRGFGLVPDNRINHIKPHSSDRRGGNPINVVYSRRV
jgi:FkbM family methyltransferase